MAERTNGTPTHSIVGRTNVATILTEGFTGDGDVSDEVDLWSLALDRKIDSIALQITGETTLTDTTVSFKMQVSMDNVNWEDLPSTGALTTISLTAGTYLAPSRGPVIDYTDSAQTPYFNWRYYRVYCTTAGSGAITAKSTFIA